MYIFQYEWMSGTWHIDFFTEKCHMHIYLPDYLYNIETCSSFALLWLHPCHCLSTDFFNNSWLDIKAQWYWHKIMEKWKQNYCNANRGWYFKNVMRVYRVLIFFILIWTKANALSNSDILCAIKAMYTLSYNIYIINVVKSVYAYT